MRRPQDVDALAALAAHVQDFHQGELSIDTRTMAGRKIMLSLDWKESDGTILLIVKASEPRPS